MGNRKLCLCFNSAPLYRESIYMKIDQEFDCDWYFRPIVNDIRAMDISKLKNAILIKYWGNPFKVYWKRGVLGLLFSNKYKTYLMGLEVHCLTDWIFVLLASTFFPKKKIYSWSHGYNGSESFIESKLKKWLYSHISGTFVYGKYSKSLMIKEGIDESKIFVIHNSLRYSEQLVLRNQIVPNNIYKEHFNNNFSTLIFIGRLTKVKKLFMVIEALKNIKDKGITYNMVFVGGGSEEHALKKMVKENGIEDQVWFYGECYDEKKNAELIYNADLCVSPGNVGLTAMHSLVFGTPVLTHNNFKKQMPEFEAIKEGRTGCFFEQDNVSSLANSIMEWFSENQDKRADLRRACFEEIDTQWNPDFQIAVLKKHLSCDEL